MNAKIIYATITGNNEKLADLIIERLSRNHIATVKEEISLSDAETLLNFDLIILVPYTYDLGALPDEGLDFYDDLATLDLTGIKYAVAGSGDDFYGSDFCKAVDIFDLAFQATNATKATANLKINLWPEATDLPLIDQFVADILK